MSSPVFTPLLCPHCNSPFLPQSRDPQAFTTCPQCSADSRIGDCASAPAPSLQVNAWQTSEAQQQAKQEATHARQSRWLLKCAGVIGVVVVVLIWRLLPATQAPAASEITMASEPASTKVELKTVYAAAKAALEASTWEGMHQHVLAPERVHPLMYWFYLKNPRGYQQRTVTGRDQEIIDLVHAPATASLRMLTDDGIRHVLLQQTDAGWKLDWESYSNVYEVLWASFLQGAKDMPKELPMPLRIERCPVSTLLPSWFVSTRFGREDSVRSVRLMVAQPTSFAVTCWPADNLVGQEILEGLRESEGVPLQWIVQVSLRDASTFPPAVDVNSIVGKKWPNPPQPRPDQP